MGATAPLGLPRAGTVDLRVAQVPGALGSARRSGSVAAPGQYHHGHVDLWLAWRRWRAHTELASLVASRASDVRRSNPATHLPSATVDAQQASLHVPQPSYSDKPPEPVSSLAQHKQHLRRALEREEVSNLVDEALHQTQRRIDFQFTPQSPMGSTSSLNRSSARIAGVDMLIATPQACSAPSPLTSGALHSRSRESSAQSLYAPPSLSRSNPTTPIISGHGQQSTSGLRHVWFTWRTFVRKQMLMVAERMHCASRLVKMMPARDAGRFQLAQARLRELGKNSR